MTFYINPDGDYLMVQRQDWFMGTVDARAPVLNGVASSCADCKLGQEYLVWCHEVPKSKVPDLWIRYLTPESNHEHG
jgi:hypothetical protein